MGIRSIKNYAAGIRRYTYLLSFVCITAAVLLQCSSKLCGCVEFRYANFSEMAGMELVHQGSWYEGTDEPFWNGSAVWLTTATLPTVGNFSMGRMVYEKPVDLVDNSTDEAVSFRTAFTFQLITAGSYGSCGGGFTFAITSFLESPVDSYGGFLGLVNESAGEPGHNQPFFAVEFDTYDSHDVNIYGQMSNDPSSSHIGIDINSLSSANITDTSSANASSSMYYPQLFLYNNYTFTCWIDYDSSTRLIRVWLTNHDSSSSSSTNYTTTTITSDDANQYSIDLPAEPPVVQYDYDLSTVLRDSVYLGFTSTSHPLPPACLGLGLVLLSWNFSSPPPSSIHPPHTISRLLLSVLLPVSFVTSCAVFFVLVAYFRRRRRRNIRRPSATTTSHHPRSSGFNKLHLHPPPPQIVSDSIGTPKMYSYRTLKRATKSFSRANKIGEGAFSSVYKGVLPDGSVVAIKRLKEGLRKEAEFAAEMKIISNVRHRNLLRLQGWCYQEEEALLVYEFMGNRSLHEFLFKGRQDETKEATGFSDMEMGQKKMKILLDIASALEYLHGGLDRCIVHRDVKAANVLLSEELEAKLGDFGLARLIKHEDVDGATLTAAGTAGYVAPEVFSNRRITDKADVYSFGVLMLVVASGRHALMSIPPENEHDLHVIASSTGDIDGDIPIHLVEWVAHLDGINKLSKAIDSSIPVAQTQKWTQILQLALICCQSQPISRPTMRHVRQMLQDCISQQNHGGGVIDAV